MLNHLFILFTFAIAANICIDIPNEKTIENKLACGCSDKFFMAEVNKIHSTQIESTQRTTTFWDKLKSLLKLSPKAISNSVDTVDSCRKQSTVAIKCMEANHIIKIHLASVGTHQNACSKNSTYSSLQTTCSETLRSSQITSKLCDDKNRCYIAINKDFEGLCSENTDNKHANFVYSCSEPEKENTSDTKLKRSKRFNKWEKDSRARDGIKYAGFLNLPYRWQYDMLQPYSFRNNRATWGTGQYDYYNYFNYESDEDYEDYLDYLEDQYYYGNDYYGYDYYGNYY